MEPSRAAAVPGSGMEKYSTGIHTELFLINETEVPASHWSLRWSHQILVGQSCALKMDQSILKLLVIKCRHHVILFYEIIPHK